MADYPEVVCICGSARFVAEMRAASTALTFDGVIVLAPGEVGDLDQPLSKEQKIKLGALHLRKIEMADRVLIVNPDGYIGESTRREIDHARSLGKPVTFTGPSL